MSSQNGSRIVANTMMLYVRMLVTTIVSFVTARYTLQLLGAEDFGIYSLVGGLVGFMDVFVGTMNSATQRYLAFELGRNDIRSYRRAFSMLLNVFMVLCAAMAILFAVGGNYFMDKLVIPEDRLYAAHWIYYFLIVSFIIYAMSIPYQAAIIAYEKMNVFAYLTFFDVISKLILLVVLFVTPIDKLITYGAIMLLSTAATNFFYYLYCKYKLDGCRYQLGWNNAFFKELFKYTSWNLFGSLTVVLNGQGQSIILNLFFGPLVNAAKAIADKIRNIVISFAGNFYMAVGPQIIKSYAAGDIDYMRQLVLKSTRMSFFLIMVLAIPLIPEMQSLLVIWLGSEHVSFEMMRFSQWVLVYSIIAVFENPITQVIRATGDIKRYQVVIGVLTLSFLPLCYFLFKLGTEAYYSMVLLSAIYLVAQIVRVYLAAPILKITVWYYVRSIMSPLLLFAIITYFIAYFISEIIGCDSVFLIILRISFEFLATALIIYFIGMNKSERNFVMNLVKEKVIQK